MAAVPGFDPIVDPVGTHDFNDFFGNEDVRRDILNIINQANNLYRCESLGLSENAYNVWTNHIMGLLDTLGDLYGASNLPDMVEIACEDANNNTGSVGELNQAFIGNQANFFNNNNGIPVENIGTRFLPMNTENTIMGNAIVDGDEMVNFQDEFSHGRYYKRSTYNAMNPKRNPYNPGAPITALRQYRAIIGGPPLEGGRKAGSRKARSKKTSKAHFFTKRRRHQRALSRRKRNRAAY